MQAGLRRAGIRARRALPRPPRGALRHPGEPGHQPAIGRGGRRLRPARGGGAVLRPGVLLPHLPELGQPRLFPQGRPARSPTAECSAPSSPSSTTTSRRRACAPLARDRGARTAGRGALDRARGRRVEIAVPAARREARPRRARPAAMPREALGRRLADTVLAAEASGRPGARPSAWTDAAAPHRGLRQLAHHGHQRRRRA